MSISQSLKNKIKHKYGDWALITGASSGIGRALADAIAQCNLNVVLTARSEDKLNELAESLNKAYGIEAKVIPADLSNTEEVEKLIGQCGNIDISLLVAAAGFGTSGEIKNSTAKDEMDMLQVNCGALLRLAHHFADKFVRQKKGGIILLSSMVGFQGAPFAANYAATKAYVQSLAEAMYHELKPHGVDVLSVAPGPVNTGFAQRANMQMDIALKPEDICKPVLKALGKKSTVLPGPLTKFLVYSMRVFPRS
ncbi:SDR family oxidoreductase, partial [Fulvivirga sp. RKSG066]|uniref:SDR family NAD(P)-dependent oxidoreductase n=1 Tax=Fulvivirga aurantia TaxID=2529383 RepID=UPI0012BB4F58